MKVTISVDAMLIAARMQRVLQPHDLQSLQMKLCGINLQSPADVRAWLRSTCALPGEQVSQLITLLPKQDLGFKPYRPLAHLATGGMGVIWLAATPTDEMVVVKTLISGQTTNDQVSSDPAGDLWIQEKSSLHKEPSPSQDLERLKRENRITRDLHHPHIVRCLDQGFTTDGQMFLVFEHMASGDLANLLLSHGPLSEELSLSIGLQICAALTMAHQHDILHRDVKPGNILLTADGHAKLADFGFARSSQNNRTSLTLAGSVLGSTLYMAPEQILANSTLDIRGDLYGLGCVLFHCLTGHPPYQGSLHSVMRAHCSAPIPQIKLFRNEISQSTCDLIEKLLQKNPQHRFLHPQLAAQDIATSLRRLGIDPSQKIPLPNVQTVKTVSDILTIPTDDGITGNLSLTGPGTIESRVHIYCVSSEYVIFGKLRDPGVDICLRNYPEKIHRQTDNAISRRHFSLSATENKVMLEDLSSSNGTYCDGVQLLPGQPKKANHGQDYQIDIAHTLFLRLRVFESNQNVMGISLYRSNNMPHLIYTMVLKSITLGDHTADVSFPGATQSRELSKINGIWSHRSNKEIAWKPLRSGDLFLCGNIQLIAQSSNLHRL